MADEQLPSEKSEDKNSLHKTSENGQDKKNDAEKATILEDDLRKLPPEAQRMVHMFMSRERYMGPLPNPVADKINEKHIDTILQLSEKDSERNFKGSIHQKYFVAFIIVIFVALFVFLTIWLSQTNKELYMDILKIVIGFLGGLGSGYGIKAYRDRDKD